MVSVVMPVFNGAAFVAGAVHSVQQQEGAYFELLIHDDGSTDETPAILAALSATDERIDVSRAPNRGAAASRNVALARARGDYVAFLDHDDLWPNGRLARQIARLDGAPAAPAVLGETLIFETLDAAGLPAETTRSRRVFAGFLQAGLFRRAAIEATGGFDDGFKVADDFDLLLRMIERCGPIEKEGEVALWYRLHPGQWTADLEFAGQGTVRALAASLRRRREANG